MSETEIVTPEAAAEYDLSALAERVNTSLDTIEGHEEAFSEATLEHRLQIGQVIAQAQEKFGMSVPNPTGANQHTKEDSARRAITCSPLGFGNWLKREIPRLKDSTARKYATAFHGLGVAPDATPRQITERIKKLRHDAGKANLPMPSLASLYKAAPKPAKKEAEPLQIEEPKDTAQLRLEDARECFHTWRETFDTMVERGQLDDLDREGLEAMKEFILSARDRINKRLK
jgi:hypothetical protein